jgi:L-fuconolactonase
MEDRVAGDQPETSPLQIIDAHHHLWRYSLEEYPWISDNMQLLRRDFLLDELHAETSSARVNGTVVVQARQSVEETHWLLELADADRTVRGVVGWVPLISEAVGQILETFRDRPKLKGVRHVLHDEADDYYMLRKDFQRGIALLREFDLRYDLLIFERHLPQTIGLVDAFPDQLFVVDHIAKPPIRAGEMEPWASQITELAKRGNVFCKLSGMVTEADWEGWTEEQLRPYFDLVIDAFGPERLMFGSDWPVLRVASGYDEWLQVVRRAIAQLTRTEQAEILAKTAIRFYEMS